MGEELILYPSEDRIWNPPCSKRIQGVCLSNAFVAHGSGFVACESSHYPSPHRKPAFSNYNRYFVAKIAVKRMENSGLESMSQPVVEVPIR